MYLGWTLRLMLVIALLPWGAFHGAGHGPLQQAPLQQTLLQMAFAGAQSQPDPAQGAETLRPAPFLAHIAGLMVTPKRCKSGVLSGRGCFLDATLASVVALAPARGGDFGRPAKPARLALLLPQAPPRRPPRVA